jgi:TM2 domain-containing membrane protein YozV
MLRHTALAVALAAVAGSLQGCDIPRITGYLSAGNIQVSTHKVAFWRQQPDYWEKNAYMDHHTGRSSFNSCTGSGASGMNVCSGHGVCEPFDPNDLAHPIFFCKCDEAYAGLECSQKRKKQSVAWMLSLVLGPFGADEMYLGWTEATLQKQALTLLGLLFMTLRNVSSFMDSKSVGILIVAIPWLWDVVRIGLSPVPSFSYRLTPDLPRPIFTTMTIMYFAIFAAAVGVSSTYYTILNRRRHSDRMQGYTGQMYSKVIA